MLLIDLPRGRIGVNFKHRPFHRPTLNTDISKRFLNGTTKCEIWSIDDRDAKLLASGIGVAKFPDPFCKALGRKQALTSALRCVKELGIPNSHRVFDKGERDIIWQTYWNSLDQPTPPTESKVDIAGLSMEAGI